VAYPKTPDRRYFVVRGRLWRATNPNLPTDRRAELTAELTDARRAIAKANRDGDDAGRAMARRRVHAVKIALGERGPVWWEDGAPDHNRKMVHNTPYADWHRQVERGG
jgi:hypothetical protein